MLNIRIIERIPKVEKTCWKYAFVLLKNKYNEESKNGYNPSKFLICKQGVADAK